MSRQPRFKKTRMANVIRMAVYGLPLLASAQLVHAADGSVTLDSMEVVEQRDSYKIERTKVATKTDTPLRNIPQSISVVTDQQIKDQNMQSMADVVRYVPGVQMAQGEGHRDAPILIQGHHRDGSQVLNDLPIRGIASRHGQRIAAYGDDRRIKN